MRERKKRSFLKAISWRVLSPAVTMLVVFAYTGEIRASFAIGLFDVTLKLALYFAHERMWVRIPWGLTGD